MRGQLPGNSTIFALHTADFNSAESGRRVFPQVRPLSSARADLSSPAVSKLAHKSVYSLSLSLINCFTFNKLFPT